MDGCTDGWREGVVIRKWVVCSPSTSDFLLWKCYLSTTSCPPTLMLLGPIKGNSLAVSLTDLCAVPNGCAGCSCRQMERMVLVPDGAQYKRANVFLVGPIQTLLQPSGITELKKMMEMVHSIFAPCLRLLQTVSKIFSCHSMMTPSTWWLGSMLWALSSVRWQQRKTRVVSKRATLWFYFKKLNSESPLDKKPNSFGETKFR